MVFSSFFESAVNLSAGLQHVHDNLPESARLALAGGVGTGASYFQSVKEGVNSRIGVRKTLRTKTGPMEVVELGTLGDSVTKVRSSANDTEFALKRIEAPMEGEDSGSASPLSMKVTVSLEALKTLVDRTELIMVLPESPHLVRCVGSQADNSGKTHAQLLLFELCEESLTDLLTRNGGALKVDEALQVLEDVAAGLHCLHTAQSGPAIHGSVRPDHVLRGKSGWKLGGFSALVASGEGGLEEASDVLQLGILIFESLFGSLEGEPCGPEASSALLVPHGRPADALEGRLCLLLRWMLAADPRRRPTAKQVTVMVDSLRCMPAKELMQAMPPWIHTAAQKTCETLTLKVLIEAIESIDGSDRRILINKYGEEALLNPKLLPAATQAKALSAEQSARIRDLPIFLGCGDGAGAAACATREAKQLGLKLAEAAAPLQDEDESAEAPPLIQCVDLMDMTQDLISLPAEEAQPEQPASLLDMFDPVSDPVVSHTDPPNLLFQPEVWDQPPPDNTHSNANNNAVQYNEPLDLL